MKFIQYTFDNHDDLKFVIDTGDKITYVDSNDEVYVVSHIKTIASLPRIFKYTNQNRDKLMETIYVHSFQGYTGQWAREYVASYDD